MKTEMDRGKTLWVLSQKADQFRLQIDIANFDDEASAMVWFTDVIERLVKGSITFEQALTLKKELMDKVKKESREWKNAVCAALKLPAAAAKRPAESKELVTPPMAEHTTILDCLRLDKSTSRTRIKASDVANELPPNFNISKSI